jgi:hypothetical protein
VTDSQKGVDSSIGGTQLRPNVYIVPFTELLVETLTDAFLIVVDPNDVARRIYSAKKANHNVNHNAEIPGDKLDGVFSDVVRRMRREQSEMERSYDFWMKGSYGVVKYSESSNPEQREIRVKLEPELSTSSSFYGNTQPIEGILRKKDTYEVRFLVWPHKG